MKTMTTAIAAGMLSLPVSVAAQQTETAEPEPAEGIPATVHQEQTVREIPSERFQRLDEDASGSISMEEAQADASLSGSFRELDQDGDGSLSRQEFAELESSEEVARTGRQDEGMPATPHQEQAAPGGVVAQLDENGDGMITRDEAQADTRLAENWNRYDENADGVLDTRELDRFEQDLADTEEAE